MHMIRLCRRVAAAATTTTTTPRRRRRNSIYNYYYFYYYFFRFQQNRQHQGGDAGEKRKGEECFSSPHISNNSHKNNNTHMLAVDVHSARPSVWFFFFFFFYAFRPPASGGLGAWKPSRICAAPRLRTPPPLRSLGGLPPPPPLTSGGRAPPLPSRAGGGRPPPPPPPPPPSSSSSATSAGVSQGSFLLKSPQEVLSYFVDLVPTFYVSLQCVGAVLPDEVREEFQGRGRLLSFFKRYPFFFDVRTDAMSSRFDVRLRADVSHPRRGEGDKKYMMADVGETTQYVARPDCIVSMEPLDAASASGSVAIQPLAAPPAVKVHLEERVPVLDRLRALIPEREFAAIEELEEVLPEDVLFHPYFDCQGGLTAIATKFPEHFQVVRGKIRLRPPELSPLALDEYTLEESPIPEVARMVYEEVCRESIPRWVPLTPMYERLTMAQRREIKKKFKSFAGFLRSHGRSLSVSQDMLQVAKWISSVPPTASTSTSPSSHRIATTTTSSSSDSPSPQGSGSAALQLSEKEEATRYSAAEKTTSPPPIRNTTTTTTTNDSSSKPSGGAGDEASFQKKEEEAKNTSSPQATTRASSHSARHPGDARGSSSSGAAVDDNAAPARKRHFYPRRELLNIIFDRFPPDKCLSAREILSLLPDDVHPTSLPRRLVPWLAGFPNYFVLDESAAGLRGGGGRADEKETKHDDHHVVPSALLPEDVPCLRRSSSRQPLDVALMVYSHFPASTDLCEFDALLAKMTSAQRHVVGGMGAEHLGRVLPSWLKALTSAEAAKILREKKSKEQQKDKEEGNEAEEEKKTTALVGGEEDAHPGMVEVEGAVRGGLAPSKDNNNDNNSNNNNTNSSTPFPVVSSTSGSTTSTTTGSSSSSSSGSGGSAVWLMRLSTLDALKEAIRNESSKIEKRELQDVSTAAKRAAMSDPAEWIKDLSSVQTLLREEQERRRQHVREHPRQRHSSSSSFNEENTTTTTSTTTTTTNNNSNRRIDQGEEKSGVGERHNHSHPTHQPRHGGGGGQHRQKDLHHRRGGDQNIRISSGGHNSHKNESGGGRDTHGGGDEDSSARQRTHLRRRGFMTMPTHSTRK